MLTPQTWVNRWSDLLQSPSFQVSDRTDKTKRRILTRFRFCRDRYHSPRPSSRDHGDGLPSTPSFYILQLPRPIPSPLLSLPVFLLSSKTMLPSSPLSGRSATKPSPSPHGILTQHTDDAASKGPRHPRGQRYNWHEPNFLHGVVRLSHLAISLHNEYGLCERTHLRPRHAHPGDLRSGRKQNKAVMVPDPLRTKR